MGIARSVRPVCAICSVRAVSLDVSARSFPLALGGISLLGLIAVIGRILAARVFPRLAGSVRIFRRACITLPLALEVLYVFPVSLCRGLGLGLPGVRRGLTFCAAFT